MTLCLAYRRTSNIPVEVEGITPEFVCHKSVGEIEKLEIHHGNEKTSLAEFFEISGDPTDGTMRWEGDLSGVHWIGAKMAAGQIHVAGNAGRHVGSDMTGGEIVVDGNVGDWVGGEMRGGRIHVHGGAGHQAGAAYRGSPRGMSGGLLLIQGEAGNEIGHTMRRGLIAVGGKVGDLVGFNMLAGSILLFGDTGIRHGAGMRRGTLAFWGDNPPDLLPTFRHACRYRPDVLPLLFSLLRRHRFPFDETTSRSEVDLYHGDMIEGGRGEILLRRTQK